MKDDDDGDDDEKGLAASRYPCMPSLVALQQMRNRLHLAYLGKKLMKWTAQATVRELRRIAHDLNEQYDNFKEEIRQAFILLARSRYYQPLLNKIVLENVPLKSKEDPYSCLGIEKGGQTITETKTAWRDLLRKMIHITELRKGFCDVDIANKTATKRCNVIKRVLIPRLKMTIAYILSELEEREREETFRIKQFKKLKDRKKKKGEIGGEKKDGKFHICSCCLAMLESDKEKMEDALCDTCKKLESEQIRAEPCMLEDNNEKDTKVGIKQRLETLRSYIDDVIGLTKAYTQEGIVSQSMEKFIKTCCAVKEEIEGVGGILPFCEVCKQEMQKSERIEIPLTEIPKVKKSVASVDTEKPTEELGDSIYNLSSESAHKFGYFEKKFKEIVKVTRLKNDDGTVSEEKQVITIRTERRNPKKPWAKPYGGSNDEPYFGPGYDEDSRNNFTFPRNTKSELTCHSNNMGEPKLRSCVSAGFQKSKKDVSTNYDSSNCCSVKCSQSSLAKSSSHSCGPRTLSYGSKPASQVTSQTSINIKSCVPSCKSTSSAQTCCIEIPVQKPVQQCHPCCLSSCHGDAVEPDDAVELGNAVQCKKSEDKKGVSFKTTSTDALWGDAWTSTTELNVEPSRLLNTTQSTVSCRSNCGTESKEPLPTEKPVIKCRIRILPKANEVAPDKNCGPPPTVKEEKQKEENNDQRKEIVLRGSLIDILKSLIIPISKPTENTSKVAFIEPDKTKLICKNCISKLSSYVAKEDLDRPSAHSNSSSCKLCQASIESNEQELSSCYSYSPMPTSSPSLSCKSLGVESSSSQLKCCQSAKPSSCGKIQEIHKKPHTCCLDQSKSSKEPFCCTVSAKSLSKSVSCSSIKSIGLSCTSKRTCFDSKDVATCTKRSDTFDVRPLRNLKLSSSNKSSNQKACTCVSEPNLGSNRTQNAFFKKSKSFCENSYDYFRW